MDKIKTLIAEDNKLTQEQYNDGLPDDSYEKRFANNGNEALEIYKSWNPDLIVLDLMMPVKSGYATLKEIRKIDKKLNKMTAVIVVSVLSGKEDIIDCAKLDIQGYIIKPFKISKINNVISIYYQKFKSSQNRAAEPQPNKSQPPASPFNKEDC